MNEARISFAGVNAGYGGVTVLRDINLDIGPGELVGAVGPSGSGKTTLLRTLIGQTTVQAGTALVDGRPVGRNAPVGYVPQLDMADRDFPLTARGMVLLGTTRGGHKGWRYSADEVRRANEALDRLGLMSHAGAMLSELSGGQYQRVLLSRALVSGIDVLLLDEPTSGLDMQARHDTLVLLDELRQQGLTILLTTHDLNWVATHLPRVLWINHGISADGTPEETFTEDVLRATYGAETTIVRVGDQLLVADAVSPTARPS
jgi:zinc/manganese transport system ATP-binding protein